jgi:hypothetical protein
LIQIILGKGISSLFKGPGPLQRGDNHKNEKNRVGSFQNIIVKNYEARKAEFYMKAFRHETKAR